MKARELKVGDVFTVGVYTDLVYTVRHVEICEHGMHVGQVELTTSTPKQATESLRYLDPDLEVTVQD